MSHLILHEAPQIIGYKCYVVDDDWTTRTMSARPFNEEEAAHCTAHSGSSSIATSHLSRDGGEEEEIVPVENCTCGYYYASTVEFAARYYVQGKDTVLFEVAPHGKIIECEFGGRAQYLKVLKVIMTEEKYKRMKKPDRWPVVVLKPPKREHKFKWVPVPKLEEIK